MPDIKTLGDNEVWYRHWPSSYDGSILLLVHGLGAHSARWEFLAGFFAQKGHSSYAIELKGFGRTPDRPRGHIDSFDIYYRDVLQLRKEIEKEHPGKKVFLLGESMGALIVFILACLHPEEFAGQILISPAFRNAMKFPLPAYLTLIAFILFNTKRTLAVPFTSAMCTRDPEYQKVMDNNPDELRTASIKTLLNILFAQMRAGRLAKKISLPTLFLIPGRDVMIDEAYNRRFFARLPLRDKTKLEYPEMRHALSIELGREKVFADILNWMEKRT
jgi:alpha-beta hydrolase superfamily lysophospholipase